MTLQTKTKTTSVNEVTCWETEDGKLFKHRTAAELHQKDIDEANAANAILDNGGTIGDSLRAVGYAGEIDPILDSVTKQTKLIVPHLQGRRWPCYSPKYFELGLDVYVGEDADSWRGGYGSSVTICGLVCYARNSQISSSS